MSMMSRMCWPRPSTMSGRGRAGGRAAGPRAPGGRYRSAYRNGGPDVAPRDPDERDPSPEDDVAALVVFGFAGYHLGYRLTLRYCFATNQPSGKARAANPAAIASS